MTKRGEMVRTLKRQLDPQIISRDRRCLLCGSETLLDVHEILSKSKFATGELDTCLNPRNMILLCRRHHNIVQGHPRLSGHLLRILRDKYRYCYDDEPFAWYVENEIETDEDLKGLGL
jgi:hypothetical protein